MRRVLLVSFVAWGFCATGSAATLVVDLNGGADYTDIQSAIDAAADGDTVLVKPGEYDAWNPLVVNPPPDPLHPVMLPIKSIALRSEHGPDATIIRAGGALQGGILNFWLTEERSLVQGFSLVSPEGPPFETHGVECKGGASPTISGCRFLGEFRDAVACFGASPIIDGCQISGSTRYGVYCRFNSAPRLNACTLWDNHFGIGCFEDSAPVLVNCSIQGNWAVGVDCAGNSSPTLVNCAITGSVGDGLSRGEASLPTLINCIVWSSPDRASIWVSLHYTADETAAWLERHVRNSHYDGIEDGHGTVLTGAPDPQFVSPGHWDDSGTPLDDEDDRWVLGDYHLQPGSPCIDAGTSEGAPTTDIEGDGRPCGKGVDIGPYEFGDCAPPTEFLRGNVDGQGAIDISDPIVLLTYLFLGGRAPDCLDAGDANDDGELDISDAVYSLAFQFLGGPAPESPFPGCGIDPVIDGLDCQSHVACQ